MDETTEPFFESEDSEDSNESPHWTAYLRSDVELMEPYNWDFELAEVPCPKRTLYSLLQNDRYQTFFAKSIVHMKDRQFYTGCNPLTLAETLQADTIMVTLFSIYWFCC